MVTTAVTGLDDGIVYFVRAEATNLWGTSTSAVGSFQTLGGGG